MTDKEKLKGRLAEYGQEHVLAFWDELGHQERQLLAEDIAQVDLGLMARLHRQQGPSEDLVGMAERAQPPIAIRLDGRGSQFSPADVRQRGEDALRAGRLGVLLVAGGQGTRLGFDAPKGTFKIGPVSGASLFQILLEKIVAVARKYGVSVPLYLMTSPATHRQTEAYLAEHQWFGLPPKDVTVFCQGTMPAVDIETGRLLLAEKGGLFRNPDGHGGMLAALHPTGSLADCRRRGIEQLFYFQVDNPLVEMCDPLFIGHHLLSEAEISTQVVAKRTPLDRVGNFALVDGRARIIEYSDLPQHVAERRDAVGGLLLWAGSIAVHVFDVAFLERMANDPDALPLHIARKKVPYVDSSGRLVQPQKENAIKFERFIFDLLPNAQRAIAVEVDEQRVFAPLKNASGEQRDTPETVRAQMIALHTQWLHDAGARVDKGVPVEISPLFALEAEDLPARIAFRSSREQTDVL